MKEGLTTPQAILRAGWDKLVDILDRAHYVRFDFSTATKLLEVCRTLIEQYGTLSDLFRLSEDSPDLIRRLQAFKGVGPTTTRIFLRDARSVFVTGKGPRVGRRSGCTCGG